MQSRTFLTAISALSLFAPGCGRADAKTQPLASARILGIPHVEQAPDFCGEACAAMVLQKLGHDVDQDQVFDWTGIDPALGRGAYTNELAHALEKVGFDVGPVWTSLDAADGPAGVERAWNLLYQDLQRGLPSIVCMHYDESPHTTEHFRLVVGYDAEGDEVLYHEPAESHGAYRRMGRERFLKLWTFKPSPARWTLIRIRTEPKALALPPRPSAPDAAALAQHVMKLKERMPAGFTAVVRAPFVVVGDEAPDKVRERADRTVEWTSRLLLHDYFPKAPTEITDVWIFKDAQSYVGHAKSLFHETPTTPYGYYSASAGAMLMNIKPGAGTLVHELVHPFMHANAPDCPAWLNEGLASLYEYPGEQDGHLHGFPNWRLPGLQEALREGTVPSFRALTHLDDRAFYDDDDGTHYAQARYLAYYLQEHGKLREFFANWLAHRDQDPTGYATLEAMFDEPMPQVERDWRRFTLALRAR